MSGTNPDSLPLVIPRSRLRSVITLLGSATAGSLLAYWLLERGSEWAAMVVVFLCASWAAQILKTLWEGKPRLIISEDGINVDHWESPMIRWQAFDKATLVKAKDHEYICLTLRDPEAFHVNLNQLQRGVHTVTRKVGLGDLMLTLPDPRLNASAVLAVVQRQIEHARANPKLAPIVHYPLPK